MFDIRIEYKGRQVASVKRPDFIYSPVTDPQWKFMQSEYNDQVAKFGEASCAGKPVRPQHHPPIYALAVADNGDIWIAARDQNGPSFNVFSAEGQLRGMVDMPPGVFVQIPIAVAGDRLAWVAQDHDGVQTVKLFRIVR